MIRRALSSPSFLVRAALVALLAAAALLLLAARFVHSHVDGAHRWFHTGNILQTNEFSGILVPGFDATLGHVQLGLIGGGAIALVLAAVVARRAPLPPAVRAVAWFVVRRPEVVLLPLLGVVLCEVLLMRSFDGPTARVYFLEDDAMISMRYAKNLVRGAGLVFNPGERVEGYTNPLWVLVMALVHLAGPPERLASMWVLVVSTGLTAAIVLAQASILRRLEVGPLWIVVCAVATIFDENVVMWLASGLEPIAQGALVTACVWAIARRRFTVATAVLSLVPLVRADGFILAAALGLLILAEAPSRPRAIRNLALAVLPSIALVAFRVAYYGHPLPNTYYLKMIGFGDRLTLGLGGYGVRLLVRYPIVLALAAGAFFARRSPLFLRGAVALVALQCAYSIYVGGDTFWCLRFVTPVIPLAYVAAAFGAAELVRGVGQARRVMVAAFVVAAAPAHAPDGQLATPRDVKSFPRQLLSLAAMLKTNVPAGAWLTVYPAGTLPYFAMDYRFIDVLGKNDAHIAHLDHYRGKLIGHNKFDFDYVYSRRPDIAFLFDNCAHIDELALMSPEERTRLWDSLDDFAFVAGLADISNPAFLADYYPYRVRYVGAPSPPPLECTFVRKDSGIAPFWTPDGPLPPRPGVTVHLGDEPPPGAAIGPRWGAPHDVTWTKGRARRTTDDIASRIDAELAPGAKRLDVCTARVDGATLSIRVNGVAIDEATASPGTPECAGELHTATIPADVIARDPRLTHIDFTPHTDGRGLDVTWLRVDPSP